MASPVEASHCCREWHSGVLPDGRRYVGMLGVKIFRSRSKKKLNGLVGRFPR